MSFPWIGYLEVAEALIRLRSSDAPFEARYRAAISRAYYAAYCATRNYAREREGYTPSRSGQDHSQVAAHYSQGASRAHKKIGRVLERLRVDRNRADYDDDINQNVRRLAQFAVQEAHQVFALLEQLSS
jgi:uncharacterized protein (UPF0332 family)